MILIENLVKRYGKILALDHLNLEVQEGEIYGLLGPNGSGKTTVINCILALLKFDKGSVKVFGEEIRPESYHLKKQIGGVMQNVAVFEELSVYENIDYFCGLYIPEKSKRKKLVEEAIVFTGLEEYLKFRPQKLSGGLLRRLNIACGIAHKPRLIILDEPTVAVDPQSRNKILEGIKELNRKGSTIIYTSHYMEEVEQICTKISILDRGKCLATGTKEELKRMVKTGQRIVIDTVVLNEKQIEKIRTLPHVFSAVWKDQRLLIHCTEDGENLIRLLSYLSQEKIAFGRVFSEQPTLNDVFLEITGKALRD